MAFPSENIIKLPILIHRDLTQTSLMEVPTHINRTSSFPHLGILDDIFHLFSNLIRIFCKQILFVTVYEFNQLNLSASTSCQYLNNFIVTHTQYYAY